MFVFCLGFFFFFLPSLEVQLPSPEQLMRHNCLSAEEMKKKRLGRVELQLGEEASVADEIPEKALASVKVPLMI